MVVRHLDEITVEWLTSLLRNAGHLTSGSVTSVDVEAEVFSGAIASLASLRLTYSDDAKGHLPTQLLLKSSKENLHEERLALGRKEVEFYRAGVSQDLPIPRCYDLASNPETGHTHILMEDLSTTHFHHPAPIPPSPDHCELIVDCLSRIHAHWWESPDLGGGIGDPYNPSKLKENRRRLLGTIPAFMDYLGPSLLSGQRRMYERILQSDILTRHDVRLRKPKNITLIHGDSHTGNFMLPHDLETGRAVAIDWHLWGIYIGTTDLAFFIAHKWSARRRAEFEQPLLRRYHQALIEYGVEGFGWDDCWHDYRESVILAALIPIGQFRRKQHDGLVWSGIECSSAAYEDLDCAELL